MSIDLTPFWISFKLSLIVTLILFIIALPVAWWLAHTRSKTKPFIEALCALPIVLPPTVLGFYLLIALSHRSTVGGFFKETFDLNLLFSFEGLVVASCFYSFPFMMQPLQAGLESLNKNVIDAAYTLGKSRFQTLRSVILPMIKPSVISASVITFAHTMGEFGVVLMVGGNIPGVTKVASIAIYDYVEEMDYASAHVYSLLLIAISFAVLFVVYYLNRKAKRNEVIL
ncbi:MAG: molybdate ABC transporter permease subunit [Sulfurimonadaceae bacterium]|nr:molybdate ABC transporter permease subunit [Sulfurimonadaceae bacterium]